MCPFLVRSFASHSVRPLPVPPPQVVFNLDESDGRLSSIEKNGVALGKIVAKSKADLPMPGDTDGAKLPDGLAAPKRPKSPRWPPQSRLTSTESAGAGRMARPASAGTMARHPQSEPAMRRWRSSSFSPAVRLPSHPSVILAQQIDLPTPAVGIKHRKVKKYYQGQTDLIEGYKEDQVNVAADPEDLQSAQKSEKRRDAILAAVTLVLNVLLLICKVVAASLSGSYAVISSVVDSAVDITSGMFSVLWDL